MIDITTECRGAFWSTLLAAPAGEGIIYARGSTCKGVHAIDAMDASDRELVALVQKKNGPFDYSYIAQKLKSKPKRTKR